MEVEVNWEDPAYAGRPLPGPDALSAEFWGGARAGELRYQECPACGHSQFYPRYLCTACGATPEWRAASGVGRVHTFTVVRKNLAPPFADLVPYVLAMVELTEGPRMMGNVTHCDRDRVHIGMAVTAYAVAVDDQVAVPFWRPTDLAGPPSGRP